MRRRMIPVNEPLLARKTLAYVADELNGRPRKRFGWDNPTNRLHQLLSAATETTVATKP